MDNSNFINQKWQQKTKNKQIIGNQGLYFVSFELAREGLNVAITARNAKGADILIYNEDCSSIKTIQVKSTTNKLDVNVGQTKEKYDPTPKLICDYWIFVDLSYKYPRCFIFTREELQQYISHDNNPGKDGKWSWWLPSKIIYDEKYMNVWDKVKI